MYEKKVIKELFQKLNMINKVRQAYEDRLEEGWQLIIKDKTLTEDEQLERHEYFWSNDKHVNKLSHQEIVLQEEIETLLVDTKYCPLVGLTESQIGLLRESKIITPHYVPDMYHCIRDDATGEYKIISKPDYWGGKSLEKNLDFELLKLKDDMKRRLGQLEPLHLSYEIHPKTKVLYKQIVNCYVYGIFDACCVLCRAVAELTAVRYIEFNELNSLLSGKNKEKKKLSIFEILDKHLSLDNAILGLYGKISNKADHVLHDKSIKALEEDALNLIKMLQQFIKDFPKYV